MTDAVDVAQRVIRARFDDGYRYCLTRRSVDEARAFIRGKREEGGDD
jgi:hypothetical protein